MRARVEHGDMREVLARLAGEGALFDSCVTDPPYHLSSIVKRFGGDEAAAPRSDGATGVYKRAAAGFMGQKWDGGEIAFRPETWRLVFDVLKPGSHLLAFGGTRTFHRMAVAIEDAGFEIRDTVMWLYGSGFPKSHNLAGAWQGWGTALKPAVEPIVLARKPLAGTVAENVAAYGTGALNIEGCRTDAADHGNYLRNCSGDRGHGGTRVQGSVGHTAFRQGGGAAGRGRWPANVVHDGSAEVDEAFPEASGAKGEVNESFAPKVGTSVFGDFGPRPRSVPRRDPGSAARFFYTAKAGEMDRVFTCSACGAHAVGRPACGCMVDGRPAPTKGHPTVKPVELMRWLCRLVTPPGGTVLDPFAGTGTTGVAALAEGFTALLIERETAYVADIRRRLDHVQGLDTALFRQAGRP